MGNRLLQLSVKARQFFQEICGEYLLALDGMDEHTAKVLATSGIVSQEDLAELAVDELLEIQEMDEEQAKRPSRRRRKKQEGLPMPKMPEEKNS